MKVTVENIKFHPGHDDSHSYTAVVLIDGKKAFSAFNDGWGGPDCYEPLPGYTGPSEREINEWRKANLPGIECHGMTLDPTLELAVGDFVDAAALAKENKKVIGKYDRMLKSQLCGLRDGKLAAWPKKHVVNDANKEQIRKMGYTVLSGITPRPLDFSKAPDSLYAEGLKAYCPDLWEAA
jgi:hypothetical protein